MYCILLILTGAGLAWFGLKKFNISLAASFAIPSLAITMMMVDAVPILKEGLTTWLLSLVVITVLILLFAKFFSYVTAWWYIALIVASILVLVGMEAGNTTSLIILIVPTVILILIRKQIKAIVIGVSSGYAIGFGISGIVFATLFMNGQILDSFTAPAVIMIACVIGGLGFQFMYVLKNVNRSPEKEQIVEPS